MYCLFLLHFICWPFSCLVQICSFSDVLGLGFFLFVCLFWGVCICFSPFHAYLSTLCIRKGDHFPPLIRVFLNLAFILNSFEEWYIWNKWKQPSKGRKSHCWLFLLLFLFLFLYHFSSGIFSTSQESTNSFSY